MAKYKCPTLGDCDKANSGYVFEIAAGGDIKCPECNVQLEPQMSAPTRTRRAPTVLVAGVVAALLIAAGGGYFYTRPPVVTALPEPSAAPVVTAQPEPSAAPWVSTAPIADAKVGIAPSDAETRMLRQEGDSKLANGAAAEAELASGKAAANEMLKLAISKMAQGKLDEAEKDLIEARTRAPKQSLVYYNMAILRLKQGRTDDAMKEFETSFSNGFAYFDKLDEDSDLDTLRKTPRFAELVARYRPKAN